MGVGQRTQISARSTPRKRGRRRTVRTGAAAHGGGVAAPVMLVEGLDDLRLPLSLLGLLLPLLLAPGQGGAPPRAAAPLAGAVAAVVVEAGPRRRPGPVQHLPGGPPGLAAATAAADAATAAAPGRRRAAAAGMRKLPIASSSSTTGRRTGPASGGTTSGSSGTAPVLVIQLVAGRGAVQHTQRAEDGRVGGTDRGGRVGVDQRVAGVRARRREGGDGGRTRLAANAFLLPLPPPRRGRGHPAAGAGRWRVERGGAVGLVGEAAAGGSGQHALARRFCQLLLAAAAVLPNGAQGRLRCGIVLLVRVLFCHDIYGHK